MNLRLNMYIIQIIFFFSLINNFKHVVNFSNKLEHQKET